MSNEKKGTAEQAGVAIKIALHSGEPLHEVKGVDVRLIPVLTLQRGIGHTTASFDLQIVTDQPSFQKAIVDVLNWDFGPSLVHIKYVIQRGKFPGESKDILQWFYSRWRIDDVFRETVKELLPDSKPFWEGLGYSCLCLLLRTLLFYGWTQQDAPLLLYAYDSPNGKVVSYYESLGFRVALEEQVDPEEVPMLSAVQDVVQRCGLAKHLLRIEDVQLKIV